MSEVSKKTTRAQISRAAIQRLSIAMRHLLIRGSYKPLGISGEAMIKAMLDLEPEIYGTIADPEKVELNGLLYIFQRLPQGIEECRYIRLISKEGYESSSFKAIVPAKRRRNCFRIDVTEMKIEMTRGRSDVYDVLTHLTFMYIEAEKIRRNALDHKGRKRREWILLEENISALAAKKKVDEKVGYSYLSTLLGRTYAETAELAKVFASTSKVNNLFNIVYWLGHHSIQEFHENEDREISFSPALREKIGEHLYGTIWAQNLKKLLHDNQLLARPLHIISANLHSVMNTLFARPALGKNKKGDNFDALIEMLSKNENQSTRDKVTKYAKRHGMHELNDKSGTNIGVQIFDCNKIKKEDLPVALQATYDSQLSKNALIVVMDYAFGEQAYECMDELLKPYELGQEKIPLDVQSINIMGKAGILAGNKGDIMIPNAHVFEGSADNYPVLNALSAADFEDSGLGVYSGSMITVLGTSLQNRDILRYFLKSSWKAIGLEMEGAHYQKAIQAASRIRDNISQNVTIRYAYYASDNPLETGSTLASGGLGVEGVKPTYAITHAILKGVFLQ